MIGEFEFITERPTAGGALWRVVIARMCVGVSNQLPVQVGLAILGVPKPELALATLLAITPVLAVFLFSQRFLVSGVLAGATRS